MTTKEKRNRKVAAFGGGIAGLSAAHELIRLGYSAQVYEANKERAASSAAPA